MRFDLAFMLCLCAAAPPALAQQAQATLATPPGLDDALASGPFAQSVNCAIRPVQVVNVAAPVNGIIAEVHVKPGQAVRTGDALVTFDTDIARTDLAMAEAKAANTSSVEIAQRRLTGLSRRVERLQKARQSRAISEAD